jgi:hypothetical protein
MKTLKIKRKNGFSILAIILVIVAVIVAIGVWALSGKTNTSNSGDSGNSIMASTIVNDSMSIKLAYDTLNISGVSNIIFVPNQAGANNMLDPVNGITAYKASAQAINKDQPDPMGTWVMSKTFGTNLSPSNPDTAILLSGVKDTICKNINKTLHGSDTIPEYGPATGAQFFVNGATVANPNTTQAIDFASGGVQVNSLTWDIGCIKPPGAIDQNLFFKVLKIN